MKKKVLSRVIACAITGSLVLSVVGCGGNGDKAESSEKKSKVAIVYTVTGKGDLSFNDAACKGAENNKYPCQALDETSISPYNLHCEIYKNYEKR